MHVQTQSLLFVLALCLTLCMACQASSVNVENGSNGQTPKGWVVHKDPTGFSVQIPQGWRVHADRSSGRIDLEGQPGEQVLLWPIFIPAPLRAEMKSQGWCGTTRSYPRTNMVPTALDIPTASAMLQRLATKIWLNVVWEAPQPVGTQAIRMNGHAGDRMMVIILTWIASPKGNAGYVYAIAAPKASYRQKEETFARILQSFQVAGTPLTHTQGPAISYVRWQDPRENAFSLEVPRDWKANGGLFRFASIDVRASWETTSPDGQIRITGGDAELPTFAVPDATLQWTGFTEGRWYSPGYGVNMLVRRYLPGTAFVKEYVTQKVTRGCSDVAVTELRDRPDAVQAINAVYRQYGNTGFSTNLTAGEIAFTCRKSGQLMHGYYFASTQLTQAYGISLWNVQYLYGYLAASGKESLAQEVLDHILTTVETNPQWAAMQQNVTANTSKIVSRTNQEVTKIMSDSYWTRQSTLDELSRRRSNATLGVVDVVDPVTGREFKVESSSNYYWIDQHGIIIGTQTDTRPNLDFRELTRLP